MKPSKEILQLIKENNTSNSLSLWAEIIKYVILVCAAICFLIGCIAMKESVMLGLIIFITVLIQAFVAFLLVHCIRATAIITEAATLIVADHVDSDKALLNTNKEGTSEAWEKKTEVQMQKDEKKNITPIIHEYVELDGSEKTGDKVFNRDTKRAMIIDRIEGNDYYCNNTTTGSSWGGLLNYNC